MSITKSCILPNCNRPCKAKGYCNPHYQKLRRYGDPLKQLRARHGMSKTPTWYSWAGMVERATSTKFKQHKDYIDRNITVCERWTCVNGFQNFLEDMGVRPDGLTLDRIDNSRGYEPSNCRWATIWQQQSNMRSNNKTAGVCYDIRNKEWVARLMVNGAFVLYKRFGSYNDAVHARRNAEAKFL